MSSRKIPKVDGNIIEDVIGMTIGGALGGSVGGVLASGALAAMLHKIGKAVDKKRGYESHAILLAVMLGFIGFEPILMILPEDVCMERY